MEERLKVLIMQMNGKVNHPDLRIAIPIFLNHHYTIEVVQAENAFNETIEGI